MFVVNCQSICIDDFLLEFSIFVSTICKNTIHSVLDFALDGSQPATKRVALVQGKINPK